MEENKQYPKKQLLYGIIYVFALIGILMIANIEVINRCLSDLFVLLRPVINGLLIAYLCNPFFRFFERRVFCMLKNMQLRRTLSLTAAFAVFILLIVALLSLILPMLTESVVDLATNYDTYLSSAIQEGNKLIQWFNDRIADLTLKDDLINYLDQEKLKTALAKFFSDELGNNWIEYLKGINVNGIISKMSEVAAIVTDLIFGLFISIYFLSSKEKRSAQISKFRRALFGEEFNAHLNRCVEIATRSFGGFLRGKMFDSLIVAVLLYVATSALRIPYAILLSTIIAVFNIIPLVGPIIGMFPALFILLLSAPDKVIPFLLILFIVTQLDNNIIAPQILGTNTGVSSLCVIIAITTMGNLWGLPGMLLGVPIFATVLEFCDIYFIRRLQKKGLPSGLANYYASDTTVDPIENSQNSYIKAKRRFENKLLGILQKMETEPQAQLAFHEKLHLSIYRFLKKIHFVTEISEDTMTRFTVERILKDAENTSAQAFQYQATDTTDAEQSADTVS